MSETTLRPCPWCGGSPVKLYYDGGPDTMMVACENDDCSIRPRADGETPSAAITAWNTRTPDAAALSAARRDERERCAQIADRFTCGLCGMDGKAAAAIRALLDTPEGEPT